MMMMMTMMEWPKQEKQDIDRDDLVEEDRVSLLLLMMMKNNQSQVFQNIYLMKKE